MGIFIHIRGLLTKGYNLKCSTLFHQDYEIDERQLHVIKYAYCAALISSNIYDDIVKAIQELNNMESNKSSIPAIYIQMARAYCKLNRYGFSKLKLTLLIS